MITRLRSRQSAGGGGVFEEENFAAGKLKRAAAVDLAKENEPTEMPRRKRTAFGDITNAIGSVVIDSSKKEHKKQEQWKSAVGSKKIKAATTSLPQFSLDEDDEESGVLLSTASSSRTSPADDKTKTGGEVPNVQNLRHCRASAISFDEPSEYDKKMLTDPFNVPHYAGDIFKYYKAREVKFKISDYMCPEVQPRLTNQMRAILVDWMVEIQENFELNHETLYQAVKICDLYLSVTPALGKDKLQLLGSAALFVSCKFDERQPPALDDFLYICDDAYTREHLLDMEQKVLRALDFDIGMPISYRYIRRFAKASKCDMRTLTLGRYILERSLMFYEFMRTSDCLLAASAFLLAIKMTSFGGGQWTETHEQHSTFKLEEVEPLMWELNKMLQTETPVHSLKTIKTKYEHEVFFEVAKISPLQRPS